MDLKRTCKSTTCRIFCLSKNYKKFCLVEKLFLLPLHCIKMLIQGKSLKLSQLHICWSFGASQVTTNLSWNQPDCIFSLPYLCRNPVQTADYEKSGGVSAYSQSKMAMNRCAIALTAAMPEISFVLTSPGVVRTDLARHMSNKSTFHKVMVTTFWHGIGMVYWWSRHFFSTLGTYNTIHFDFLASSIFNWLSCLCLSNCIWCSSTPLLICSCFSWATLWASSFALISISNIVISFWDFDSERRLLRN